MLLQKHCTLSLPPSLPPSLPLGPPLSSPHRREPQSEQLLFESATDPLAPKISFVSTVVNQSVIQPFLFTNYRHHPSQEAATHYQSRCDVKIWEAIMASTAAPGYFEEVKLGKCVHQVGGALASYPGRVGGGGGGGSSHVAWVQG